MTFEEFVKNNGKTPTVSKSCSLPASNTTSKPVNTSPLVGKDDDEAIGDCPSLHDFYYDDDYFRYLRGSSIGGSIVPRDYFGFRLPRD